MKEHYKSQCKRKIFQEIFYLLILLFRKLLVHIYCQKKYSCENASTYND